MRKKERIRETITAYIAALRAKKAFSKSKMAEILGVDRHTWIRWETGASSPSIDDLITMYDKMHESVLPPMLNIMYPDEDETTQIRKEIAQYYLENANDSEVRKWYYMMHSMPRSEVNAQIEEFCAVAHLPKHFRYFVAEYIYMHYQLARRSGELRHTDVAMPDIDVFSEGLKRTQRSAFDVLQEDEINDTK